MSRPAHEGVCRICGRLGKLSFDHVPPEAAFNNRKVFRMKVDDYWGWRPGDRLPRRDIQQRGAGDHSLCERCNSETGGWYGGPFVEWCRQGMAFLERTGGRTSLIYLQHIRPLPILKQVVTMFLSFDEAPLRTKHPDLVRFVKNPDQPYLDPRYRFFVYYVAPGCLRRTSGCAVLDIRTGGILLSSEFSFPPFGYMMTIDSEKPDRRLFEITGFARFQPGEKATVRLDMAVLPTHTPVPGDYRAFEHKKKSPDGRNTIVGF